MPLPTNAKATWPPKDQQKIQKQITNWDAWYSGDVDKLTTAADQAPRKVGDRLRFWRTRGTDQRPKQLHVPLAGDIATTSSDLIFGEPPTITFGDQATQDRFDVLVGELSLFNRLLEAGEVAAALGGVYLRPVWDDTIAPHPLLTAVHPDRAVPDFTYDRLTAVTVWEEVVREGAQVWRHLERHEPGVILHGLYIGTQKELGDRVALDRHPATAGFEDEIVLPTEMAKRLLVDYVPNMLPNRTMRHAPYGRADVAQQEDLLDALDETWTSWMRDIRLGAARILVAEEFLTNRTAGQGATFDVDKEVFSPLNLDPGSMEHGSAIEQVQFDIRTEEHADTVSALMARIVDGSGYSPETFGIHEGGPADSGRALRIRQGKTFRTKSRKEGYTKAPLGRTLETIMLLDRFIFGQQVTPERPTISFSDGIQDDERERAETLELFDRARAVSTWMKVKMAQPELEGKDLDEEVRRVQAEQGIAVEDPMQAGALA